MEILPHAVRKLKIDTEAIPGFVNGRMIRKKNSKYTSTIYIGCFIQLPGNVLYKPFLS